MGINYSIKFFMVQPQPNQGLVSLKDNQNLVHHFCQLFQIKFLALFSKLDRFKVMHHNVNDYETLNLTKRICNFLYNVCMWLTLVGSRVQAYKNISCSKLDHFSRSV